MEVYSCAELWPGAGKRELVKDDQLQTMLFKGERELKLHGRWDWEVWKSRKSGENGSILRGMITLSKKVTL